ncbi:nitrophenyl compound nitroreductase subunit ArsF family protein [Thermoproteota archaeon]
MVVNRLKTKYAVIAIVLILAVIAVSGLVNNKNNDVTDNLINQQAGDIERIEIIHFHGTHQCYSCITVGNLAEETVNTYFKDELASGKITFQHIDGELPENYELVKKYGITSASLWIGNYYKNGSFVPEENVNVWYKINDKKNYMNYLKGIIDQKIYVKK